LAWISCVGSTVCAMWVCTVNMHIHIYNKWRLVWDSESHRMYLETHMELRLLLVIVIQVCLIFQYMNRVPSCTFHTLLSHQEVSLHQSQAREEHGYRRTVIQSKFSITSLVISLYCSVYSHFVNVDMILRFTDCVLWRCMTEV
jgi:hypothetical protein